MSFGRRKKFIFVNRVIESHSRAIKTKIKKNIIRVKFSFNVYIHHRQYQIKPRSSTWFSAACAAAIVHRKHFLSFVAAE